MANIACNDLDLHNSKILQSCFNQLLLIGKQFLILHLYIDLVETIPYTS